MYEFDTTMNFSPRLTRIEVKETRAQKPSPFYGKSRALAHELKDRIFLLLRPTAPAEVI